MLNINALPREFPIGTSLDLALVKKAAKEAGTRTGKGAYEDVFLNDIDRSNASVFLNAKSSIPHFYSSTTCNFNTVLATCKEWSKDGMYLLYASSA